MCVQREKTFTFSFPECEKLAPPVMPFVNVSCALSLCGNFANVCLCIVPYSGPAWITHAAIIFQLQVSFSYSGKPEDYLYRNLELGVDCDSRIALVGPNGAGALCWCRFAAT